jgi:ubiquinone biosynthesis protein UbiJ
MTVIELWWLSLAIFAVVAVVVAVLLGLVVQAAKGIDHHAEAIWTVGKQIAGDTVSIWILERTNSQVMQMFERTRALERAAASLEERLGELGAAGGGER